MQTVRPERDFDPDRGTLYALQELTLGKCADTRLIWDHLRHRNIQHPVRYAAASPAPLKGRGTRWIPLQLDNLQSAQRQDLGRAAG